MSDRLTTRPSEAIEWWRSIDKATPSANHGWPERSQVRGDRARGPAVLVGQLVLSEAHPGHGEGCRRPRTLRDGTRRLRRRASAACGALIGALPSGKASGLMAYGSPIVGLRCRSRVNWRCQPQSEVVNRCSWLTAKGANACMLVDSLEDCVLKDRGHVPSSFGCRWCLCSPASDQRLGTARELSREQGQ